MLRLRLAPDRLRGRYDRYDRHDRSGGVRQLEAGRGRYGWQRVAVGAAAHMWSGAAGVGQDPLCPPYLANLPRGPYAVGQKTGPGAAFFRAAEAEAATQPMPADRGVESRSEDPASPYLPSAQRPAPLSIVR